MYREADFPFYALTPVQLLGLSGWAEARGEIAIGQQAVMSAIKNRTLKGGWFLDHDLINRGLSPYHAVILKPFQFSSFNDNDPNRAKMLMLIEQKNWQFTDMAQGIIDGTIIDNTFGATYYFNPAIVLPEWAKTMTVKATIGNHIFLA